MELTKETVRDTIIRLQGQIDTWVNIYQSMEQEEKKKSVEKSEATNVAS